MSINNGNAENSPTKRRPPGVWILALFGLVFGGIFPLSFEPMDILMGYTAFYCSKDIPIIKIVALLNVVIFLTSILTWKGSKIGKIFFLISITIFFVWDGLVSSSFGSRFPRLSDAQSGLIYLVDFGYPLFCIWYFNRPSTREFYRKSSQVIK